MHKEELLTYLKGACAGRRLTVKSRELGQALHINKKTVKRWVGELRRAGIPICSGPGGYFYARDAGDIYQTIRFLWIKMESIRSSIHGLEQALGSFQTAAPSEEKEGGRYR